MASLYGTNAAKRLTANPKEIIDPGEARGRLRVIYDKYTVAEDMSGDTVVMGAPIPKGARVIQAMLKATDLGTGCTADFGYQASADGVEVADLDAFMNDIDLAVASTGDTYISSEQLPGAAGIFKKFSAEVQPVVTVTGTTDASGSIETVIMFIED